MMWSIPSVPPSGPVGHRIPGPHEVHLAEEAGVVRPDDVTHLDRVLQVLDLQADETLLPMPSPPRGVARRAVPGRRRDHLVVGDPSAPDLHPVLQATPGGV